MLRRPPRPPGAQHKKLSLTQGALQAEQQPILERRGIVESLFIQDQGLGERTDLQEMLPIARVACKPGDFQAQDQPYRAQPHLGYEPLKTQAVGS